MAGLWTGINSALSGLQAEQTAINVTAHNIANVNTPNYARQSATFETAPPINDPTLLPAGAGQLGTGVQVAQIVRSHDDYIQQQQIYQNATVAGNQANSTTLGNISTIFNDPTSNGFSTLLSNYFTAWQGLSSNPSDGPTRTALVAQGQTLTSAINSAATQLYQLQVNQDNQITPLVGQINQISTQLAQINGQIDSVAATGQQPNDLLNQRDTLLNNLSQIANINAYVQPNGEVNVVLNGAGAIVQGISSFGLVTSPSTTRPGFTSVATANNASVPVTITGGQLGAAFTARDTTIQSRIDSLNALTTNLVTAVNTLQASGYDLNGNAGILFFTYTGSSSNSSVNPAMYVQVNPALAAAPSTIAAASTAPSVVGGVTTPAVGDGSQAQKVADLQTNAASGQSSALPAQYNAIISALGVAQSQATNALQTNTLVQQNLNAQQASVSGVSLNQEASNLMMYQNGYEAAARAISIIEQTMSDMIQQLGR